MGQKKTEQDYHDLAKERGFEWVGVLPKNVRIPTKWKCSEGHEWEARYNDIQQGKGCPKCLKVQPESYHALARQRSFTCLGPEVVNTKIKTRWRCEQGHEWSASYSHISQGTGCPECLTVLPGGYHALAQARGFTWIGPEVTGVHIKTGWQCHKGHCWEAKYATIQQGRGCPECLKVSEEDYQCLATERGFTWIGPMVTNVQLKTGWRCGKGHEWQSCYENIQQGRGCPECAELSKFGRSTQRKELDDYRALAERRGFIWVGPEVRNVQIKTTWRCGEGHQWQAHYGSIQQGSGCPKCAGHIRKEAEHYRQLAAERGFTWIGPIVMNAHMKTGWQCQRGHNWRANYNSVQQGTGCPECSKVLPDDYRKLAAERSFTWLGPEVDNAHIKTSWCCQNEHEWDARYNDIQQGSGCPHCWRERQRGKEVSASDVNTS